jgi:apolipoprotein N-acyltransferase
VSGRRAALLVAIGALALVASYPPFRLPVLSFGATLPAVLLVADAVAAGDPRRGFRWGFWYGLASNGLVLYWLIVALWRFTRLSALGFMATVLALAVFHGVLFWFVVRVRLRAPAVPVWVTFPVAWTALEWTIGHLGDLRFPWLGLGTSLADAPVLAQWADFAGARGLTLWLAWCGAMLAEGWNADTRVRWLRGYLARRVAPVAITIALAWGYGAWRMRTLPIRDVGVVGTVQPNVGYEEKWQRVKQDAIMAELLEMSDRLLRVARPQLVVWPEAAIPGYLQYEPEWERATTGLARSSHVPILAGGLYQDSTRAYYNAALLVDSTGTWRANPVYAKHYLVPIVERVPFLPPRWFRLPFFGGFGRGQTFPVYQVGIGRFGVMICYESAFEMLSRRYRRGGAEFLVNVTNDAWYGLTSAPYQHESHLVLRAIETRMGVVRAANSGISEFLDPLGRAYQSTGLEEEAIVVGTLRTSDAIPLFVRLGDWVGWLVILTTLGFVAMLLLRRES